MNAMDKLELAELFIEEKEQVNGFRESLYMRVKELIDRMVLEERSRCARAVEHAIGDNAILCEKAVAAINA